MKELLLAYNVSCFAVCYCRRDQRCRRAGRRCPRHPHPHRCLRLRKNQSSLPFLRVRSTELSPPGLCSVDEKSRRAAVPLCALASLGKSAPADSIVSTRRNRRYVPMELWFDLRFAQVLLVFATFPRRNRSGKARERCSKPSCWLGEDATMFSCSF